MTVAGLLRTAVEKLVDAGISPGEAVVEARLLVMFSLRVTPERLRMHPEREVAAPDQMQAERLVLRRANREPLAYIIGYRDFYGLRFRVTPDVLIPRPETEFLVEAVLDHLREFGGLRFVDVGTGSGCIAVAVAKHAPDVQVVATDISTSALEVARGNAISNDVGASIRFAHGDILAPVAAGLFDVIASNPPYISPSEIEALEPEVRDWEPRKALGLHADDLHFYRRLAREAPPLLAEGGLLAVEVGEGQADAVCGLWRAAGLQGVRAIADYAGILRVVLGRQDAAS